MTWPAHLLDRAGRAPDLDLCAIAGSTPVVAFGDPVEARVATLGINPSSAEFLDPSGTLLTGTERRLATLESLGVSSYADVTVEHAAAIVDDCASYFERRPYRWFTPLDDILRGALGRSYRDRSACHLDLVQCATAPLWGALAAEVQDDLLRADLPFLRRQLTETPFDLVVVNGQSVRTAVERARLVQWQHMHTLSGPPTAQVYVGQSESTRWLAWTCNLQSQHGAPVHIDDLTQLLADHANPRRRSSRGATARRPEPSRQARATPGAVRPAPTTSVAGDTGDSGPMPRGIHFTSRSELASYFASWLERSDHDTIGDVGTYGGSAWATIDSELGTINLNRDTTREAVEAFVAASRNGQSYDWIVVANRRGPINKVLFCEDRTPGWFAYLREPFETETRIGLGHSTSAGPPNPSPQIDVRPASAPPVAATTGRAGVLKAHTPPAPSGTAAIVQFPHPGREHVPTGNHMGWNVGDHARKFLSAAATRVTPDGSTRDGPIAFWGEWEPPSRIVRRWARQPGLPTVLHEPYWTRNGPDRERQNTDPWVFGDTFLYSNCKQLTPTDSPSALQTLPVGSLVLFGSGRDGAFVLDTVVVIGAVAGRYRPMGAADEIDLDVEDAFRACTIDSLARLPERYAHARFTLFRGASHRSPVHGMYSFVPCVSLDDRPPRFARPAIRLDGIINPSSTQSPSGAKVRRPLNDVQHAWELVVEQVRAAGLDLAVRIDTPPEQ